MTDRFEVRLARVEHDWEALAWLRAAVEMRLRVMEDTAGDEFTTDMVRGLHRIARYAEAGRMYLVTDERLPVACHALTPDGDPAFWTDAELGDEALYLDNAMVHPSYMGHGLGRVITAHAVSEGYEREARSLRLDCQRGNTRLRDHWARLGFSWVRDAEVPGRASGTLMEMKL
jgi:GNAT superfamily N-acetyltransferase